ncbi:hypothetical protein MOKP125_03260 [Mycobacterium avium subsp. hominissuis]
MPVDNKTRTSWGRSSNWLDDSTVPTREPRASAPRQTAIANTTTMVTNRTASAGPPCIRKPNDHPAAMVAASAMSARVRQYSIRAPNGTDAGSGRVRSRDPKPDSRSRAARSAVVMAPNSIACTMTTGRTYCG